MENWLKHVKENEATFQLWLDTKQHLQPSNDIFAPIIPEFVKEFPNVNIYGCPECLHDMLRWAKIQLKKVEQGAPRTKKE